MNLAFVALSASGKNAAVDAATALMPPEAIHVIQALSALSLIHDDDVTVGHKVVIFSEADSIPEDGPAASAIRSLATSNEMAYDTVENLVDGGRRGTFGYPVLRASLRRARSLCATSGGPGR